MNRYGRLGGRSGCQANSVFSRKTGPLSSQ